MDRRSVSVSPVFRTSQDHCIHTKNVFSLLDLSPKEESYQKIKKHMHQCAVCESVFKTFEMKSLEAKVYIPKPQIDSETKAAYEREIHELFKSFDLNEKELLKKKIKSNIKKIDMLGVEFFKNLASKSMLKTYALGVVLFVVLRRFFN